MAANQALREPAGGDFAASINPAVSNTSTTVALGFQNFRRVYDAPPDRKWQVEILERINRLTCLPTGWDGYGSPPVKWDVGMFALWVLESVMRPRTSMPRVVPSSAGAVQLEWHDQDIDLELYISAPYETELWFTDSRENIEVSEELTNDFTALKDRLNVLTSRQ
jgi:hypothetical protein